MPFFTVIIPTYNRASFLTNAIESVLNQKYQDFEIVIVDDCSTDNTREVVHKYKSDKIKYFKNSKNLYKGGARNIGIENSSGKYICFLDDDDYYFNNHLQVFYNEIVKKDKPISLFFTIPVTENINFHGVYQKLFLPEIKKNQVAYVFDKDTPIATPRICVHSAILKNEKFNRNIKIGQDTELIMRIALKHKLFKINEHTVVTVNHGANSRNSWKSNIGIWRLRGYRYIINNHLLRKEIPISLWIKMIAYCFHHISLYHSHKGHKLKTMVFTFFSMILDPFDGVFISKVVMMIYNIPVIGKLLRHFIFKLKNYGT